MPIQNTLITTVSFEGDPYKVAEDFMDKLFPFFHDYAPLSIRQSIKDSDLSNEEKELAFQTCIKIENLLFNKFEYAEKSAETKLGIFGYLSQKGRDAKKAGGHYKYLGKLDAERDIQKRKEELDLKSKEWIYKYRRLPFFFSGSALVISIVALMFTALKYFQDAPKKELNSGLNQPQINKQVSLDTMNKKSNDLK